MHPAVYTCSNAISCAHTHMHMYATHVHTVSAHMHTSTHDSEACSCAYIAGTPMNVGTRVRMDSEARVCYLLPRRSLYASTLPCGNGLRSSELTRPWMQVVWSVDGGASRAGATPWRSHRCSGRQLLLCPGAPAVGLGKLPIPPPGRRQGPGRLQPHQACFPSCGGCGQVCRIIACPT